MSIKFNSEKPFDSLAMFSNAQAYLTDEQKDSFGLEVSQFFSEKGYMDQSIPIPAEYRERVLDDLAILLGIKALAHPEKMRTLAAVEKVTGCHFSGLNRKFQVYPLEVERGGKLATRWGWVSAEACIESVLKEPSITQNAEGFDPNGAIIRHDQPILTEHETYNKQFIPAPTQKSSTESVAFSRLFNPEQPFESIARFSDRFAILNHTEQKSMVVTIRNFFISKALEGQTVELPENYRERFSKVDLKLLIDLLHDTFPDSENKELEKHRFIAAVQKVTQLQFTSLKKEDRVYQTVMDYKTAHSVAHDKFSGWLRHGDVARTFTAEEENCGYVKAQPIHLEGMTPLLALTLQQFQYRSPNLDAVEVAGKVESAIALLCLAREYSWTKLRGEIEGKLNSVERSSKFQTSVARMLHRSGVHEAMKDIGIEILRPDTEYLSDEALYQLLRYNLTFLDSSNFDSIIGVSIGEKKPNLKALIRYRKEIQNGELSKQIDEYIVDYFVRLTFNYEYLQDKIKKFIADRIESVFRASEPIELAVQLDKQLQSYSFSEEERIKLAKFFDTPEVRQFFIDASSREKLDDLINGIGTFFQVLQPSIERFIEASCNWQERADSCPVEFSSALNDLIGIVSKRYQDKKARVEQVLVAFENCFGSRSYGDNRTPLEMFFKARCNPNGRFDETLKSYLSEVTIAGKSAKMICTILAREDFCAFLAENDIPPSALQLFGQFLESQFTRNKVCECIEQLAKSLSYKKSRSDQLSNVEAFLKGWKSLPETTPQENASSCLFVIHDQYDRAKELLMSLSLLEDPNIVHLGLERSVIEMHINILERACFIRRFLDTFIAEDKSDLKFFFYQRMPDHKHISKYDVESFDKEVQKIPFQDAEELLSALTKEEAHTLFAEYNFLPQKEFFETRLKAYIATKPIEVAKPPEQGKGWLW